MSILGTLIQTTLAAVEETNLAAEIAKWKEMFLKFFGSEKQDEFPKGDEGFYNLCRLGQHETIVDVAIARPEAFCRANLLSAFFQGKSREWKVVPVEGDRPEHREQVNHVYPRPEKGLATMASEAVTPLLFSRLREIAARHVGGVNRDFWVTDPNLSYYKPEKTGGKDAQAASSLMHSILNVIEGSSPEDKEGAGKLFETMFGQLPKNVFDRLHPRSDNSNGRNNLVGGGRQVRRQGQGIPPEKYAESPNGRRKNGNGNGKIGKLADLPEDQAPKTFKKQLEALRLGDAEESAEAEAEPAGVEQ